MGSSNGAGPPTVKVRTAWPALLAGDERASIAGHLPAYLMARRWFGGKARTIDRVEIAGALPLPAAADAVLTIIDVVYAEGAPQRYLLPLAWASGDEARRLVQHHPGSIVALLQIAGAAEGILFDAIVEPAFAMGLLALIAAEQRVADAQGEVVATTTHVFGPLYNPSPERLQPSIGSAEQSNTSVIYGDRLILKLFRRLESGINPDLEIGRFLTERTNFTHIAALAGAIEYHPARSEPVALAILQGFVPNQGDAWRYTLESLDSLFDQTQTQVAADGTARIPDVLPAVRSATADYLASAKLLGQRTGELHLALASDSEDAAFAPEPFTVEYQRTLHAAMTESVRRAFRTLQRALPALPPGVQSDARRIAAGEAAVLGRFQPLLEGRFGGCRIRCHGDYHLGQVLYTGADFVIIDFEGEPARPLSERRSKRSALQDVAGMLRSFHYASFAALFARANGADGPSVAALRPLAQAWYSLVSAAFLDGYTGVTDGASFLPRAGSEFDRLLDIYLLDKAIYEMVYELNNRPDWVTIPFGGILELLERST